jgi:hypothetical protein
VYLCGCGITTSLQAEIGTVRGSTADPAGVHQAGAKRHRETVPVDTPVRSHMVALGEASVLPGTQTAASATPFLARTTIPYLRENVHDILCRGWCA